MKKQEIDFQLIKADLKKKTKKKHLHAIQVKKCHFTRFHKLIL